MTLMAPSSANPSSAVRGTPYVGRFAPSPSGPLHMGSLVAAAASYLRARQNNGAWILRIEDIDPPREIAGAADHIIQTLERFGFEWDGPIIYQSQRTQLYRDVLSQLIAAKLAYRCACSRRSLRQHITAHQLNPDIYPRICLARPPTEDSDICWRVYTAQHQINFVDKIRGHQSVQFQKDQGDFLVWRKHDLPSYQLAVTVDDFEQNITEVVRGADLLLESAGQILLRKYLKFTAPALLHIPLVVDHNQVKLSKQTGATPLRAEHRVQQLTEAFAHLGLPPNDAPETDNCNDLWQWALINWSYKCLIINN